MVGARVPWGISSFHDTFLNGLAVFPKSVNLQCAGIGHEVTRHENRVLMNRIRTLTEECAQSSPSPMLQLKMQPYCDCLRMDGQPLGSAYQKS